VSDALNLVLINEFYEAFARRDAKAMTLCYAPNVRFRDPGFGELRGAQAGAMWQMLLRRAQDLEVEWRDVQAEATHGRAHWTARYTFGKTGRRVVNEIDASFRFKDGLIVEHIDRFGFWRWSRQAFGPMGLALGWTPWLAAKVRRGARAQLDRYMQHENKAGRSKA
jgi:ketosteroid isomerase-like protein